MLAFSKERYWIVNGRHVARKVICGAWESLVKTAKHCLKTVTNGHPVHNQKLYATLVEIERTINNRPITPVSDDINDFQPLTLRDIYRKGVEQ